MEYGHSGFGGPRFLLCIEGDINLASQGMRSFYEVPKVLQASYFLMPVASRSMETVSYLKRLSDTDGLLPLQLQFC